MNIKKNEKGFTIFGDWYSLSFFNEKKEYVDFAAKGKRAARLFVLSSADAIEGIDQSAGIGEWVIEEVNGTIIVSISGKSTVWDEKRYFFECRDDFFDYYYKITGGGRLDNVRFFEGLVGESEKISRFVLPTEKISGTTDLERSIKDFLYSSEYNFKRVFNPEPNRLFRQYINPFETATINIISDRVDLGGNWMFTPAPFCYSFKIDDGWVGAGLAVYEGDYNFVGYEYTGGDEFGLNLTFQGYREVQGSWSSPKVLFMLADDEYSVIKKYVRWLRANGYVPKVERKIYEWWRKPIICGWGEQTYLNMISASKHPGIYATQGLYEKVVRVAQEKGLPFGTLIIDDKWQSHYGDNRVDTGKWQDMRGFIDRKFRTGVRTLLWFKAWDCEGVPTEECILKEGKPFCVDPTNAAYEKRLRQRVHEMLSADEGCLNAYGFKVDFTASAPSGKGFELDGDIWGVELLKRLMKIIYTAAKEAKPDAMIIAHTANPYFSDVLDVLRLNDIMTDFKSVVPLMRHRARTAKIACPEWLINTDNWNMPSLEAWREYMEFQPEIGIPSLYAITGLDIPDALFTEEDYGMLRRVWNGYLSKME